MITATALELRAGPRLLLGATTFRIAPGDRVGLVGRNGAGKTTLTRVLAGEGQPAAGAVTRSGHVGYLPQDPRTGDLDVLARDRILSARGLDAVIRRMRETEGEMASADPDTHDRAMRRYDPPRGGVPGCGRLRGGERGGGDLVQPRAAGPRAGPAAPHALRWPAPPRRARPDPVLHGGGRRATRRCCSTSRRTTSTPTRSAGCATTCRAYKGGLVVISHDVGLLEQTVNRVFHLDANRAELDVYNLGWKAYLQQRETDERRRKRERANVEKQASVLKAQADRMRYKATKARAAQSMDKRAAAAAGRPGRGAAGRPGRQAALPRPGAVRQDAADRRGAVEVLRLARGLHRRRPGHRPGQPGRHPRPQRRGQDHAAAAARRRRGAGHRDGRAGSRAQGGLLRAGARDARPGSYRAGEHAHAPRPTSPRSELRRILGSFLFSGDDVDKPAAGALAAARRPGWRWRRSWCPAPTC